MKKHVVSLVIILCLAFSGGCAVVPVLVSTGASLAVPQTASLIITAASTVHKTALIAADERNADDMLADKFLTLRAQSMLLAEPSADLEASCYNGDLYLVGEFATPEDRDRIIEKLQAIDGVNSVKGVIKQQPMDMLAAINPAITDSHAETVIETGLFKELHLRSANVDVEMVQGEAVVMGVVRDREEAEEVVGIVRNLCPKSKREIKVTSLLAYQDAFEAHAAQDNEMYALHTRRQMLDQAAPAATEMAAVDPAPAVDSAQLAEQDLDKGKPALEALYARYFPEKPSAWTKARRKMKTRILNLAKAEQDPRAKKELITLSTKVSNDKHTSIEVRLVKTLCKTKNASVWKHVDTLLDDVAPERAERIQTLAMN